METINEAWLFKENTKEEISRWVSNLKYSYFWRRPSFRDEGDYIILTINFNDKQDLFEILACLKIELKKIPQNYPKPVPNKPYSSEEFEVFQSEIKDFPEYEQSLHQTINNAPAFVWIENKEIDLTFSGSNENYYRVSEADCNNCLKVEELITNNNLAHKINRDIESNIGCITKSKYPAL